MAPTPLRRLTTLQCSRLAEIQLSLNRLKETERQRFNMNFVQLRLDSLEKIWNESRTTHEEIIVRENIEEDPYITDRVFARLQGLYEDSIEFLCTIQSELETASQSILRVLSTNNNRIYDVEPRAAKLPKLDLPTFSGNYDDWENFCDLFTTLVHNSSQLADAAKLQYLKTCLKGRAADLVKDVSTTNANYLSTWYALKARFHNPRLIVNKHLEKLNDMPYLKEEDAVELRAFTDEAQRIVRALANLRMPVENWDVWFIFILAARLDSETRKAWETELSLKDKRTILQVNNDLESSDPLVNFPKFLELSEFLEKRTRTLGMIASQNGKIDKRQLPISKPIPGSKRVYHSSSHHKTDNHYLKCSFCPDSHVSWKCDKFKNKRPHERRDEVRRLHLCFNCLGQHRVDTCTSARQCFKCQGRHHSLIHLDSTANNEQKKRGSTEENRGVNSSSGDSAGVNVHTAVTSANKHSVILATAQLILAGPRGTHTRVRALLDQGSESSFISDSMAQLLDLPKRGVNIPLTGLGSSKAGTARFATQFNIRSTIDPAFQLEIDALVLPKLTSKLPARQPMELDLQIFSNLHLADPYFYQSDSVDMILGADVYGRLLRSGIRKFSSTSLIAQDTALGWVVSGPICMKCPRRAAERKQEPLEEVPCLINKFNAEESACEKVFSEGHTRSLDGRFIVRLPLKSKPPTVASETRRMALGTLSHMYQRFRRDDKLASAYRDFMSVYEELGHMEHVPISEIKNPEAWYLPHHAVGQSTPLKYKLRVVFDASRKTRENHSLNNFLLPGPALQKDISLILLNWRKYSYVFVADIVKMFRQIHVATEHRDLQRILWAPNQGDIPVDYRLTTVTYGTACAPFLALRTLLQIAKDEGTRFPLGAHCLVTNMYVDDIFAGSNNLTVAIQKRKELVGILHTAGIELDKWAANHPDLLMPRSANSHKNDEKVINFDESVKTLGLNWNPARDEFTFTTLDLKILAAASTKRAILSGIARLFDPFGWLSPITIVAKILVQDIWILKYGWDAILPREIRERWQDYCNSLAMLSVLAIGRYFGVSNESPDELHGFSDASARAYAAVVYIRKKCSDGQYRISLIAAKTKVAPVKTVSIPNLELCGAVLLVKLLRHVRKLGFLNNLSVYAWTDSQIVLAWLKKHPCFWKSFVANRVSFIQIELPNASWMHVPTKKNPADLATRGSKPNDLVNADLWWQGPHWLSKDIEHWPNVAAPTQILHTELAPAVPDILSRFLSLSRLIRVVAYCRRPLLNLRRRKRNKNALPNFLTTSELSNARIAIIKIAQAHAFSVEITMLKTGKQLPKRHILLKLNPYFDETSGLLLVGGRLTNSQLSFESKHPPILPHRSPLSRLFVRHAHRACLLGGPTLTSNTVMQHAWILGRNRLAKTEIRACLVCQRVKPRLAHQLIGDLPAARVTPARPCSSTGLDYAGPIQIRSTKGRGFKSYKGYIAVFVCFATRAIHLEAVSDLTTQSFIAAYRRFVARRGICKNVFSDNVTTFHGANKELKTMFNRASIFYNDIAATLSNDGTKWTFIPPNSPHYGGLWEAGVKSVKAHLKRVIGDKTLTFEELSTVLAQIEVCLNSRPLCPLSSDIEDLQALTPSHFLIGEVSGLIPDDAVSDMPENRLERFHLLQAIRNNFWKRWSMEYLQHLQERNKWRGATENFKVGQLVLLRDDRYPPAKWPLGRVTEIHTGPDGLVRVVTVKTASSTFRRHIARLCPLILENSQS